MKPIAKVRFITRTNRLRLHVQVQLFQPARNMQVVDVTGNSDMTMSTQLQPDPHRDDETSSNIVCHVASLADNPVEARGKHMYEKKENLRGYSPSPSTGAAS